MKKLLANLLIGLVIATLTIQVHAGSNLVKTTEVRPAPKVVENKAYKAATFRIVSGDSSGSAFAISPFHVVTCFHVVEQTDKSICKDAILTSGTGEVIKATVIALDQATDVAILEMAKPIAIYYKLATSPAMPGDRVACIKSRPEYVAKFARGEVEALLDGSKKYSGTLTSKIWYGNSGSPIVNANYEVVGIVLALFTETSQCIYGGVENLWAVLRANSIQLPRQE